MKQSLQTNASFNSAAPPPLRWVGGKGRLLGTLRRFLLKDPPQRYYEPFLGGGAMYFSWGYQASECYLADVCQPLILTYEALQHDFYAVEWKINELRNVDYYEVRALFNQQKAEKFPDPIYAAALFITLNHCGYNGVYRENSSGGYNVPQGKRGGGDKAVKLTLASWDRDAYWRAAARLEGARLQVCDFRQWPQDWPLPGLGSFVFVDSPYLAEFSQYNQEGFGEAEHRLLQAQCMEWSRRGAKVVVCNSNNALTHSIFGTPDHVVQVNRTVGNSLRGTATEAIYVFNADLK